MIVSGSSAGSGGSAKSPVTPAMLVAEVRRELGKPYIYGADGPNAFDCSGLLYYSCHQVGLTSCPRTSEEQFAWTERVTSPQAGDFVFFTGAELDPPPGHVGLVVAPGVMIDAPHTGSVVMQSNYGVSGTGVNQFLGYGRPPGLSGSSTANQSLITGAPSTAPSMLAGVSFLGIAMTLLLGAVIIVIILALMIAMKYH
jgi:NlpC/P60 family